LPHSNSCATCSPDHKPGETVKIELYRGSKATTVTVKLGRQPTQPG
jgi:S1-C subfamily serine protease